jgi:hypothetical protein
VIRRGEFHGCGANFTGFNSVEHRDFHLTLAGREPGDVLHGAPVNAPRLVSSNRMKMLHIARSPSNPTRTT